jgi:hypothetical protein
MRRAAPAAGTMAMGRPGAGVGCIATDGRSGWYSTPPNGRQNPDDPAGVERHA